MPTRQTGLSSWILIGILAITILVFLPALDNGLTNWDDPEYLIENSLIQQLYPDSIKKIFTEHFNGKYHPLTLLTYALEYSWFGLTAHIYHLNNLLLHLINVVLVFVLTRTLFRQLAIAVITTLLFAIHPMHVEPVAWITGRKDVLSTLFYLVTLLSWVNYIRNPAHKQWCYILSLFSSILSQLAKASAVMIPFVLIILDYYFQRPMKRKIFTEKIPFIICAGWLGSLTWTAIETARDFPATGLFNAIDRPFLSLHAIFLYLCKLIFPVTVSCFYPLPVKSGPWLPVWVYMVSVAMVFGGWLLWKEYRNLGREARFAVLFFVIPMVPLLHLIKINDSIIYDRFTYLPSLGVFLLLAKFYCRLTQGIDLSSHLISGRRLMQTLFPIYLIYLSLFSWQRVHTWKNSYTLWSDVIRQFPQYPIGYYNRAHALTEWGRYELALEDTSQVVKLAPNDPKGYLERGNVLMYFHQHDSAIQNFTAALRLDPRQAKAYNNRGNAYVLTDDTARGIVDYTKALEIDPSYIDALVNRAMAYLLREEIPQALADLDAALDLNPTNLLARQKKMEILNRP